MKPRLFSFFLVLIISVVFSTTTSTAQTIHDPGAESRRLAAIEASLGELAAAHPRFATEVDISMGRQPLAELLRSVALAAGVNISVNGVQGIEATCNFSRARVVDLLGFLCREHELDVRVVGNIVSVSPVPPRPVPTKPIGVTHRVAGNRLSLDLDNDRLTDVTKHIANLTGTNFIVPRSIAEHRLSGYVKEMPLGEAVKAIAAMNGLEVSRDSTSVWTFAPPPPPPPDPALLMNGYNPGAMGAEMGHNMMSSAPVEVVKLKYRSVNKLSELVPKSLTEGVEIKEFHDLNSVIVSGDPQRVSQVRAFLDSLDRRVPMVTIEVMIVDATKQRLMEIGVDAGFGKSNVPSGGSLAGGVNASLNWRDINKIINGFNGFGAVNLGKVRSNFYMELQFLEDNGIIEMQSTPKLSTLNGHEATLTSGETRYYKEMANNYYGSQITLATESYIWKPIDANLEIKITPFVSEDRQITLDISIDQTEFTAREEAEAPPGTATRKFESLIRVRDEEMVLLGGIDQNSREKSNRGLPWIARVPVIRWFFGKSRDSKSERRLNVFIKPTLVE
jgi:type IV pilus assembly protein PilQ